MPGEAAPAPLGLEAPAGNDRFPLVDPLRGVAALAVFVYHFSSTTPRARGVLGKLLDHGDAGVVLFFLISGFLLYRPFVAARAGLAPPVAAGRFYLRRALRVIPAYWVALTVLAIYPGLPRFHDRWWQLYLFGQIYDPHTRFDGISAAWSLCVEVSFYALLPLYAVAVMRALKRVAGPRRTAAELSILAALALASIIAHVALHHAGRDANFEFTLPGTFYLFALGMAVAVLSVAWRETGVPALIGRHAHACWALAAALYVVLSLAVSWRTLGSVNPVWAPLAALVLLPATVPATRDAGPVRRGLTALGVISYAFYLWHQNVISVLARHIASAPLLFVAALVLTSAIALISYRLVEAPFLRRKARLATA